MSVYVCMHAQVLVNVDVHMHECAHMCVCVLCAHMCIPFVEDVLLSHLHFIF